MNECFSWHHWPIVSMVNPWSKGPFRITGLFSRYNTFNACLLISHYMCKTNSQTVWSVIPNDLVLMPLCSLLFLSINWIYRLISSEQNTAAVMGCHFWVVYRKTGTSDLLSLSTFALGEASCRVVTDIWRAPHGREPKSPESIRWGLKCWQQLHGLACKWIFPRLNEWNEGSTPQLQTHKRISHAWISEETMR